MSYEEGTIKLYTIWRQTKPSIIKSQNLAVQMLDTDILLSHNALFCQRIFGSLKR